MKKDKGKILVKKPDKKKKKKPIAAGTEAQVCTTHGLVTTAINMKLKACIKEAKKKGGDPFVDIDPKAVELGIKWCTHNKVDYVTEETEQMKDNVTELEKIREKQRGRVLHAVK